MIFPLTNPAVDLMGVDTAYLVFQEFQDVDPNFSKRVFLFNEKRLLLLSKKRKFGLVNLLSDLKGVACLNSRRWNDS